MSVVWPVPPWTPGQVFPAPNGVTYVYDATRGRWVAVTEPVPEADSLQFRPMTPDLHDWVPAGLKGLFVGEGTPTNSPPGPKRNPYNTLTGITKWRFLCTSDGDAMEMTATSIGNHPTRGRVFTKMKKPGDAWDFTWVEYTNQYNLKFPFRQARVLNPEGQSDVTYDAWPRGNRNNTMWSGYRISHVGLINRGYGSAHPIKAITMLDQGLSPWYVSRGFREVDGGKGIRNVWVYMYERANSASRLKWYYMNKPGTGRFPVRFNVNVWVGWPGQQPNWTGQFPSWGWIRHSVMFDCRAMGTGGRWVMADGSQDNSGECYQNQAIRIAHPRPATVRVNYVTDSWKGFDSTPAGAVYRVDIEASPIYDLTLVTISTFGPQSTASWADPPS